MFYSFVQNHFSMMKHPKMAFDFYVKNLVKVACNTFLKKNVFLLCAKKRGKVLGNEFLDNETYNNEIKELINSDKPFFSCRYGNSELNACFISELVNKGINKEITENQFNNLKTGPGVFPKEKAVFLSFAEEYLKSLASADYNAYWGQSIMEEYYLKKYINKNVKYMAMRALEPFQYDEPWTLALEGKDVLVVHPFSELITEQYKKKDKLFNGKKILPDFNLKVVKAIQSSGNTIPDDYKNWNEALNALYEECKKQTFDIALVSCGSYAVPLAARLKADGKKVIVVGGVLQLFFGIKGSRWEESRPDIVEMYNDSWVRATGNYVVKDANKMVDGAAYW